jgi:hypothetical protein
MEVGDHTQHLNDAFSFITLSRLSSSAALALLHKCLLATEMFQMVPNTMLARSDLLALPKTFG